MFTISHGKGFQITFSNGWTVSVQFEPDTNYCIAKRDEHGRLTATEVEIAAWNKKGVWYKFPYDTVNGWCEPEYVAAFIHAVSLAASSAKTFPFKFKKGKKPPSPKKVARKLKAIQA